MSIQELEQLIEKLRGDINEQKNKVVETIDKMNKKQITINDLEKDLERERALKREIEKELKELRNAAEC